MKKSIYEGPALYILTVVVAVGILVGAFLVPAPEAVTPTEPSIEFNLPSVSEEQEKNIAGLIERYFQARQQVNATVLNTMIESDEPVAAEDFSDETKYIDRYDDFHGYCAATSSAEFAVAYVTFNIYFKGIEVGAPSLNRFLIHLTPGGGLYIYNKEVSSDIELSIGEIELSESVVALKKQVENSLEMACQKDKDLKALIKLLQDSSSESSDSGKDEHN